MEKKCENCKYETLPGTMSPCKTCDCTINCSNWQPNELAALELRIEKLENEVEAIHD
jgi:hypothetical protein